MHNRLPYLLNYEINDQLTFTMLKYLCINHGYQRDFVNLKSSLMSYNLSLLHLNTYVMCLRPLYIFEFFRCGDSLEM